MGHFAIIKNENWACFKYKLTLNLIKYASNFINNALNLIAIKAKFVCSYSLIFANNEKYSRPITFWFQIFSAAFLFFLNIISFHIFSFNALE